MLDMKDFTLPGPVIDDSLACCFKRYRPAGSPTTGDANSIAMVLAHPVGTHKETWEPTIEHLFKLQESTTNRLRVGEVWSSDSPNHGEAAVINEEALLKRPQGISGYLWAHAIQTLLNSGLIVGKKIIGVGHSAGSTIMILSTTGYLLDRLPYSAMILVEPGSMTREIYAVAFQEPTLLKQVMEMTRSGKDIWPSRDAALEWFSKRGPWKRWDPRVLRLLVEHGLRDLPTATYPDRKEGVTRKCTREQEAQAYLYFEDAFDCLERLKDLCATIPVHTILGTKIDLVSAETHAAIIDPKQGRKMASVIKIDGGHLIAQEKPAELASAFWNILNIDETQRSKL